MTAPSPPLSDEEIAALHLRACAWLSGSRQSPSIADALIEAQDAAIAQLRVTASDCDRMTALVKKCRDEMERESARAEAAEKDAARYSYLRDNCDSLHKGQYLGYAFYPTLRLPVTIRGDTAPTLDAAIDAALAQEKP
jgi:hypothetical protein